MNEAFSALQELGDTTRLRVFLALLGAKKNVSQITAELGLAQPQVSYHLRRLREAGLAVEERDGRWVWYQANWQSDDRNVREFVDLMVRWAEDAGALGDGASGDVRPPPASASDESDEGPAVERPKKRESDMEDFLL
ncbi:MAG: winged helix-turn-helix transcriptional regulator [Armatimonadetes bacterium]|nr:winged helix-turn-helix transcriptional regulator [Armatimonadota bacterium]